MKEVELGFVNFGFLFNNPLTQTQHSVPINDTAVSNGATKPLNHRTDICSVEADEFVPISTSLAEVFKRLRPRNCEPERLVFATLKGTPLNPKNLYNRQLAPACDAIELPRVSWHSFRHTHATLLHDAGESLKTAQSLLGHSDLETTLGVYTHAIPDSQRRAVERVAGVLDPVGLNSLPEGNPGGRIN